MSTAGPNSSGTQANTARASSISSWANPSNAASSNDSRATTSLSSGFVTHSDWLKVTNFGFSIPGGATIDGVTVEIEHSYATGAPYHPRDSSLMLVKGGTISSTDKASGTTWPAAGSEAYASYGGAADLWGLSLSDTDVNATDFGVALSVTCDNTGKGSVGFNVDHIRITIDYTAGGGGPTVKTLAALGVG